MWHSIILLTVRRKNIDNVSHKNFVLATIVILLTSLKTGS